MTKPAISLDGISKLFGDKLVLNELRLDMVYGEIIGILGPTGSGKSTLMRIIGGAVMPDEGDVLIDDVSLYRDYEACMAKMGVVLDKCDFYDYMTGFENLRVLAAMYGCPQQRIIEIVHLLGLQNVIDEKYAIYPAGDRKMLAIAGAMLNNPRVLVIDDALEGLDPVRLVDLRRLFKRLSHERGMCIVIASQQMSELERMCDRVALIDFGVLLGVGSVSGLRAQSAGRVRQRIKLDRPDEAARLVNDALGFGVEVRGDEVFVETEQVNVPKIISLLYASGYFVYEIGRQETTLEEAYYKMLRQRPVRQDTEPRFYMEGGRKK